MISSLYCSHAVQYIMMLLGLFCLMCGVWLCMYMHLCVCVCVHALKGAGIQQAYRAAAAAELSVNPTSKSPQTYITILLT